MQVSFWEKHSFYAHKDVIIIGAGLAGLWTAIELNRRKPQLKILMLDMGLVPAGASTRNAGFACFGSPTELLHDAKKLGEDKLWEIAEQRFKGIEKIRAVFGDDLIEFDNCGGYELLKSTYNIDGLDDKLLWLNKGLEQITKNKNTFARVDESIKKFNFNGFGIMIENKLEGGLHSGKLMQALTKKVLGLGVEIINSTTVKRYKKQNGLVKVFTNREIDFTCDKLLICTNGFTSALIENSNVTPGRGQILVTSPIPGLPFRGTFHFDEGFYYFRNLGNRVLLGGARNKAFTEETTTELETTDSIQNELERFLRENVLPGQTYSIDQRWSGIMGYTDNKLPATKRTEPNVYYVITCNGMGVALSPVIAEKTASLMFEE